MTGITLVLAFVLLAVAVLLYVPPRTLATAMRSFFPAVLCLGGAALILAKQVGLGSMLLFGGITLWRRSRNVQRMSGGASSGPSISSVRSAALEMELDHATGAMNGVVLVGTFEGQVLEEMNEEDLRTLYTEVSEDAESAALLDSYFDRRFPGWREDAEADTGAGQAGATGSGPMSEQEAYEVLGLASGATAVEIRQAHRRLMKTAHPDSGGSTFLASKINEAKDVLLRSHS